MGNITLKSMHACKIYNMINSLIIEHGYVFWDFKSELTVFSCRTLQRGQCANLWPSCFHGSLEFHAVNKTITTAVAYYFPAQGKLSLQWLTSRGYSLGWISENFITEFFLKRSKYSHIISSVRSDSETANISIFNIRLRRLYRLISQRRRSNAEVKWRVKSIVLSVMNVILCCSKSEHRRQSLLMDGQ